MDEDESERERWVEYSVVMHLRISVCISASLWIWLDEWIQANFFYFFFFLSDLLDLSTLSIFKQNGTCIYAIITVSLWNWMNMNTNTNQFITVIWLWNWIWIWICIWKVSVRYKSGYICSLCEHFVSDDRDSTLSTRVYIIGWMSTCSLFLLCSLPFLFHLENKTKPCHEWIYQSDPK